MTRSTKHTGTDRTDPTTAAGRAAPSRPRIKPGLRRLWRDTRTLQLGLDPRFAVVVEDVDDKLAAFLDRLDGTMPLERVAAAASDAGVDPVRADELVRRLASHGVLEDGATDARARRSLTRPERDRIAPDLAAWSIAAGHGDDVHGRRRIARVDVHGAGRVGALAAALLAHAGVGELRVTDPEPLRAADVPAAWARSAPPDAAAPARADLALDVCEQLAPSLRTGRRRLAGRRLPRGAAAVPTVALLAPVDSAGSVDLELRDELMRDAVPHLPAYVRETVGVIGPLVIPGRTPCLRCLDLSRSERDPAWPRLLAQVSPPPGGHRRPNDPDPCDGVLAAAVAALAVLQVTTLLDGGEPTAVATTVEIDGGQALTRRKTWSSHPACGCHWR